MFEDEDSDAKDLLGASLVSGLPLLEQLTGQEMAPGCVGEEEVSSEFRRVTQERAGAEEGVAGPGSKGEEAGEEG